MHSVYKLPISFDPVRLKKDLERASVYTWTNHFVSIHSDGGWNGIALRSIDGSPLNIEHGKDYHDTPVLDLCPYFRTLLSSFKCGFKSVRLLRLEAGATINEHMDLGSGYGLSMMRLHIPIITDLNVEFYSNHKRVIMDCGETWFIDVSFPHRVINNSNKDRIHLVIDCENNDWLQSMMPSYFSVSPWRRELWYKMRVIRYIGADAINAWREGDRKEIDRRIQLLIKELGLLKVHQMMRNFKNQFKHRAAS